MVKKGKKKKRSRKKPTLKVLFILFLLSLPFLIFASNPWTGACDGLPLRLIISTDEKEVNAWSNTTIEIEVTLKNKGPLLFALDDPGSSNTRRLYVELPDGDIIYGQIMANCIANVEFFGPFKSETWAMTAGGEDFDTDEMRFESGSGDHSGFRFNEPGEYRIWAEYSSNGRDFKGDSKPRSIDRTVTSNMIQVTVE